VSYKHISSLIYNTVDVLFERGASLAGEAGVFRNETIIYLYVGSFYNFSVKMFVILCSTRLCFCLVVFRVVHHMGI